MAAHAPLEQSSALVLADASSLLREASSAPAAEELAALLVRVGGVPPAAWEAGLPPELLGPQSSFARLALLRWCLARGAEAIARVTCAELLREIAAAGGPPGGALWDELARVFAEEQASGRAAALERFYQSLPAGSPRPPAVPARAAWPLELEGRLPDPRL